MTNTNKTRRVHVVGTIPASNTEEALRLVLDAVGDKVVDRLPDGETGDRANWINRLIESLRQHPDLDLAREGDWSDYGNTPRFKVKPGRRFSYVELDYYDAFTESWPEFQKARAELGRSDLSFQVGIPGPIDLSFVAFGFNPVTAFRHARPFEDATVHDIRRIHQSVGSEVIYQLEIPIELEMVNRTPDWLRKPSVWWLVPRVLRLVARSPHDTRWGIHLCVGDMNNMAIGHLDDASPAVLLANSLSSRFPKGRRLEFVHIPFAHGSEPATDEEAFYQPLSRVRLPEGVRLIAGFAHERQDLETHQRILETVERTYGGEVDVAAACGLGRRDPDGAKRNLEMSRALVE